VPQDWNIALSVGRRCQILLVFSLVNVVVKKQRPDHVSQIEQERVKYLTLIYSQFSV
jgi:hypothetical protein